MIYRQFLFGIILIGGYLNAAEPELVSDVEVDNQELCIQIYSNSRANTIMTLNPKTMSYEIKYKLGQNGEVKTLKDGIQNVIHPALLSGYVFFPPLKDGVVVPTKCAQIKIKLPNSNEETPLIHIISWRFIVRASVFDSTDSYEKIFDKNKWFSSEVQLRAKHQGQ